MLLPNIVRAPGQGFAAHSALVKAATRAGPGEHASEFTVTGFALKHKKSIFMDSVSKHVL